MDKFSVGAGLASAYTYLQITAPTEAIATIPTPDAGDIKHAAVAALISLGTQVILKLANKLIEKIGTRRRATRKKKTIPSNPKP